LIRDYETNTRDQDQDFMKPSSGRGTGFSSFVKDRVSLQIKENLVKVTALPAQESNCHRV